MKLHYQPGSQADAEHMGPTAMISIGDSLSVPGCLRLCSEAAPDGHSRGGFGILQLSLPGTSIALHNTLSPDGLRWLAHQAQALADALEATAGREAADAIARAKAAGK